MRTKLIVFSLCAFAANSLSAQDAPPTGTAVPKDTISHPDLKAGRRMAAYDDEKIHRHELGIDATPFIKFYTNFTGEQSDIPPTFFLTYRYHLKKGNIRAGIGGGVRNSKRTIPLNNGMTTAMHYDYQNVTGRIGYELFQNIAKRWQVFYGLDLRGSYTQIKADNYFDQMSGSIEGNTGYIYTASVAPVLGFRFKLNKRMSILTEASLQVQYQDMKEHSYSRGIPELNTPGKITGPTLRSSSWQTNFTSPVSVFFTIDL